MPCFPQNSTSLLLVGSENNILRLIPRCYRSRIQKSSNPNTPYEGSSYGCALRSSSDQSSLIQSSPVRHSDESPPPTHLEVEHNTQKYELTSSALRPPSLQYPRRSISLPPSPPPCAPTCPRFQYVDLPHHPVGTGPGLEPSSNIRCRFPPGSARRQQRRWRPCKLRARGRVRRRQA